LFIPEIEQNRRICFRAKRKRLRIELRFDDKRGDIGTHSNNASAREGTPRTGT